MPLEGTVFDRAKALFLHYAEPLQLEKRGSTLAIAWSGRPRPVPPPPSAAAPDTPAAMQSPPREAAATGPPPEDVAIGAGRRSEPAPPRETPSPGGAPPPPAIHPRPEPKTGEAREVPLLEPQSPRSTDPGAVLATEPTEAAVKVRAGNYTIGGAAKGAGMIHPDLATFLCFLTTDARLPPGFSSLPSNRRRMSPST